ncbi:acyl CoA:acetate/3-ketoacid CoA transferase [Pseudonocardia sp. McavD-2-B]|uniref:acyl CoA:acetate/3-ketoacid CoA transferase n=1 Tax=Pseudonocardia sp. McavD-2-B TaxID=2954499 RepID=UPI002097C949|nr:malonate decarboxylase subunit alpha [Pseudonocardia sp. McavD-2-B]MCO7192540.1 malonate decarboxylase subunit alpha [Pseudonocardia sp. McavD-2-B]
MHRPAVLTARQAADLIADGDVISVSSSSGLGCPDAVLAGIGDRFAETAGPRDLTTLHPIAAGDMSGIKGIDHLARPGLLRRVVAGSYPSGPSKAEPPRIWQMIENGEVEAYNFPSGVLYQLHRAAASRQPGVFTKVGLGSFVDPRLTGGRMNDATPERFVRVEELDGEEWLFFPSIVPDVAVIRATTADEHGNLTIEEEASPLGALDLAYAAHNRGGLVIAQVKRLAEGGSLSPQQVRIPGILVDAVVVAPDQMQTTQTPYDPAISGQLRRPLSALDPVPFSLEKVIARRAAHELRSGDVVNLGFGVSALVPHVLVEEDLAGAVSWVIEQGAVGGVPLLDFTFGVSVNPDAIMASADQFTLLQGGGFDRTLLSFLEIDRTGSVNVHHLPGRRHVTAGVGGFADIVSAAPEIVFIGSFTAGRRDIAVDDGGLDIRTDGPHTKFVEKVASPTFSGAHALARGQKVTYVTERAVLQLRPEGLTVTEIAPGVDLERDVLARSAFPLLVSDELKAMPAEIFQPHRTGLRLPAAPPHTRIAALRSRDA